MTSSSTKTVRVRSSSTCFAATAMAMPRRATPTTASRMSAAASERLYHRLERREPLEGGGRRRLLLGALGADELDRRQRDRYRKLRGQSGRHLRRSAARPGYRTLPRATRSRHREPDRHGLHGPDLSATTVPTASRVRAAPTRFGGGRSRHLRIRHCRSKPATSTRSAISSRAPTRSNWLRRSSPGSGLRHAAGHQLRDRHADHHRAEDRLRQHDRRAVL